MSVEIATWSVRAFYVYTGLGLLLLPWWHWRGLRLLDETAATGPWGFRVLISPGLVALWPVMLQRARHGTGHPAEERNAHRACSEKEATS
jgi:hypothetical protein